MWTISTHLKNNELIGQGLADIRQKETPAMCIMQISYPCFVFSFNLQHIRNIRNGILKHLYNLKKRFARFVKHFASIHNVLDFP